jgi:selenocysteine-specific elongation factor
MHVVATAGHVDHGKSSLVRALTGRDPDRYAEEKRRGLTLDLGFAWTTLPSGADLAFVDVPGHERFVATMLAGVGPVPAVVLVVAADAGWQPQSQEHLVAIDALGARHGLLVVTKSDLADPQPVIDQVAGGLAGTTLEGVPAVAVSSVTGAGLDDVRRALDVLVASLPAADADAPVRLWVDRSFSIKGAGTVVTGTLGSGTLELGDELIVVPSGRRVTVRGLQSQERAESRLAPVSRAAVNLRGVDREYVGRGDALVTPGAWTVTADVDVLLDPDAAVPVEVVAHVGSAGVTARVRPLGPGAARLRLTTALPLHVGDRLLLRDPGSREVTPVDVVDVAPLPLTRRGAAGRLAASLRAEPGAVGAVRRRGAVRAADLQAAGYGDDGPAAAERIGDWWVDAAQLARWRDDVVAELGSLDDHSRLAGIAVDELRQRVGVADLAVLAHLLAGDDRWQVVAGRVRPVASAEPKLPGLAALLDRLDKDPFDAPTGEELDVEPAQLAHGVRTGVLLHLGRGVYVSPRAPDLALTALAALPQPFTMSAARQALGVSRRVGVPLLEHLDGLRRTRRVDETHRQVVTAVGGQASPSRSAPA